MLLSQGWAAPGCVSWLALCTRRAAAAVCVPCVLLCLTAVGSSRAGSRQATFPSVALTLVVCIAAAVCLAATGASSGSTGLTSTGRASASWPRTSVSSRWALLGCRGFCTCTEASFAAYPAIPFQASWPLTLASCSQCSTGELGRGAGHAIRAQRLVNGGSGRPDAQGCTPGLVTELPVELLRVVSSLGACLARPADPDTLWFVM